MVQPEIFVTKMVSLSTSPPAPVGQVCDDSFEAAGRVAMLIGCSVNQEPGQSQVLPSAAKGEMMNSENSEEKAACFFFFDFLS